MQRAAHLKPIAIAAALATFISPAMSQQNPQGSAKPGTAVVQDRFLPLPPSSIAFTSGLLADRSKVNEHARLLNVDEDDMLDCFERRPAPHQDWQGEHVGKFLHAATLAWKSTNDPKLKEKIDRVVHRLLRTQEPDGYLGTYIDANKWTRWDVWVHKYDLIGLLTYHQYTGDRASLKACIRIGDLLVKTFGTKPGQRDLNAAGEHKGLAATSVLEPMVILYRATDDQRYLDFAHYVVDNYDAPSGPALLSGLEQTKTVLGPRSSKAYEMTSNLSGLLELYRITGSKRLLDDSLIAWNDISDHRLYPTGTGSVHEFWSKDGEFPPTVDAELGETCVSVTWEQFNMHLLRLLGEAKFADHIEWTVYNHLFAAQKPTGEAWCYYTPLQGAKPYSPKTTCCLSSGPRGIALLTSFATMTSADGGIVENLFYQGEAKANLPCGEVVIKQQTDYPASGRVDFTVEPSNNGKEFPLRIRIPHWATSHTLTLNGKPADAKLENGYALLTRKWKKGDHVQLDLPMQIKTLKSEDGRVALTYGPMVLALDAELNPRTDPLTAQMPKSAPSLAALAGETTPGDIRFTWGDYQLRPYAFAGQNGGDFTVWLKR